MEHQPNVKLLSVWVSFYFLNEKERERERERKCESVFWQLNNIIRRCEIGENRAHKERCGRIRKWVERRKWREREREDMAPRRWTPRQGAWWPPTPYRSPSVSCACCLSRVLLGHPASLSLEWAAERSEEEGRRREEVVGIMNYHCINRWVMKSKRHVMKT